MDLFSNGFDLASVLDMFRRRLWAALTLFSLILTLTISLIVFLPNIYTASAVVLIEGQQIPQEYVRSTVTMGIERRLQIISQEILSRTTLEQLIKQFTLYRDHVQRNAPDEVLAAKMRRDIDIEVTGRRSSRGTGTVAFQISLHKSRPSKGNGGE